MRKTAWSNYRIYFICALHQTVNVQVLASTSPLTRWISSSVSAWRRRTGFSLVSRSSSRNNNGHLGSYCGEGPFVKCQGFVLSSFHCLRDRATPACGPHRWSMPGAMKKQWLPHWFDTFLLSCTNTWLSSTPDQGHLTATFLVWREQTFFRLAQEGLWSAIIICIKPSWTSKTFSILEKQMHWNELHWSVVDSHSLCVQVRSAFWMHRKQTPTS